MKLTFAVLALLACLLIPARAIASDYVIWTSPLTCSTGSGVLQVQPWMPDVSIRVTTVEPGDLLWVNFPLSLPSDVVIDAVEICYELASPQSYISQTRLTRMTVPTSAVVHHDDPTDRISPIATCYISDVDALLVGATTTLALRLNFASEEDWIDIGAIGIHVSRLTSAVDPTAPGSPSLQLSQNRPNPFSPPTIIDYMVEEPALVRVTIHDVRGRTVRMLCERDQIIGPYSVEWDGRNDRGALLPSGTYFYRVAVGDRVGSKRMVVRR